jgi:leucyl aminopeptidase
MDQRVSKFDLNVATVSHGVAIARIDKNALELLSAEMHEKYHKCAGFIVHNTEDEAFLSVENAISADTSLRLVDYTIDNQANVNQLIPETQETVVRQTILDLSSYDTRRHDQPSGLQSANYIKNKWDALTAGREDISVEFFDNTNQGSRSTQQPSIILKITGTELPDEVVVLGAHQDSIRSGGSANATAIAPGADDDASGIASLTEAIRIIVAKDFKPKRTVHFMAYAAEEVGLWGSNNIASNYNTNNINVIGMMQLDMTNYKGSPNIDVGMITDFTNAAQNAFIKDLINAYLPELDVVDTACGYACSDHAPWTNNGFPASFPHESNLANSNNLLHSANDLIEHSGGNANHAVKFSKIALAYVGELAKGSIPAVNAPGGTKFDFDGDAKADISIFRPGSGEWWYLRSSDNDNRAYQFGTASDKLVPADFTGDGVADIAFWRESTAEWFVLRSEDTAFFAFPFGAAGDIPAPGDFDGDGIADPAVFRPSNTTWYILRSSDGATDFIPFGASEDKPVVGDYDNDGKDDIAIYRPSVSQWWILRSDAGLIAYQFGTTGDKVFTADFSGDGTDDIGLWRPTTGEWLILRSEDAGFYGFPFGVNGDIPVPADYDGDGTADPTVFRPATTTWYSIQSTDGSVFTPFGAATDKPAAASYVFE